MARAAKKPVTTHKKVEKTVENKGQQESQAVSGTDRPERLEDKDKRIQIIPSKDFLEWLDQANMSLSFTTYQASKLFFIGLNQEKNLSIFERTLEHCMGLCIHEPKQSFFVSTNDRIWRFENAVTNEGQQGNFDSVFIPQVGYITGDLDTHDMGVDKIGRPIFINTLFNCISTVSETHSFKPLWKPAFISEYAPEDRCHLNGMAMENGVPMYVTAISDSNEKDGWREKKEDGGIVIEVDTNEVISHDLSMPHSPRLHNGKLYLHNSGKGEFGFVDLKTGKFEAICFCPGYLRGLSFHDKYALVTISKPRHGDTFKDLPLDNIMSKEHKARPRCGVLVIDLEAGKIAHSLILTGVIEELYDVVAIEGLRNIMAIGFKADDIKRVLSIDEPGELAK